MPRYTLRTLLILLAVGPMVLTGAWFNPRLLIAFLSFVPFFVFFGWQFRLRSKSS